MSTTTIYYASMASIFVLAGILQLPVISLSVIFKDIQYNNLLGFSLCERLRTHKVFQKIQCFYLNYHKFSIKSYALDVY